MGLVTRDYIKRQSTFGEVEIFNSTDKAICEVPRITL